jgi:hypothetical protein
MMRCGLGCKVKSVAMVCTRALCVRVCVYAVVSSSVI